MGTPRSGMNLSDTTTSINITGLTPNTGYNISLSAWTRGGQGETNTTMGMTDEEGIEASNSIHIPCVCIRAENNSRGCPD